MSKIPQAGKIFEIGSATGRDARYFREKGYEVLCTDIVPEALNDLSRDGFEVSEYDFRDKPKPEWKNNFDGCFANAVLLHASSDDLKKSILNISSLLRAGGITGITLKNGTGEEVSNIKMDSPRYFRYYNETDFRKILVATPFEIINIALSGDDKWLRIILKKKPI